MLPSYTLKVQSVLREGEGEGEPSWQHPCFTLVEGAFQLVRGMSVLPVLQS